MGWGDFGSDGSVHWRIHHHDNPNNSPNQTGVDNSKRHPDVAGPEPLIGEGKATPKPNHPEKFRVTLTFKNAGDALSAYNAANPGPGGTVISIEVPVQKPVRGSSRAFNPPEVSIDW